MKAKIIVTDDSGNTFEHEFELSHARSPGRPAQRVRPPTAKAGDASEEPAAAERKVDMSLPVLPFRKRYGARMSGRHRFALLVARIAEGDLNKHVPLAEVEKQWNKMTQLMGRKFHPEYAKRAREEGWVHSPEPGHYVLLAGWKGALGNA